MLKKEKESREIWIFSWNNFATSAKNLSGPPASTKDSPAEKTKKKISKPKRDSSTTAKKGSERKLQAEKSIDKVKEVKKETRSQVGSKTVKPVKLSRPKKDKEPDIIEKEEKVEKQTQHTGDIRASNDPRNK